MANKVKKQGSRAKQPCPLAQARKEALFFAANPGAPESSAAAQRRQELLAYGKQLEEMSHTIAVHRFEAFRCGITNREFNIRIGLPPDQDAEWVVGIPGSGVY